MAAIKVIAEPNSDPAMVADVERAVDVFNQVLKEDMNVTLTRDVKIFICPTQQSYMDVLHRELKLSQDKAEHESKITGGLSNWQLGRIALNGATQALSSPRNRNFNTAHELFHQAQAELSGNKNNIAPRWLLEGTADYIGARVTEKSGYRSMESYKLDETNFVRKAASHASTIEILNANLDQWLTLMEQKKYPYQMADLMVYHLTTQTKNSGYLAIAEYFRLLKTSNNNDNVFSKAFGLSVHQFNIDVISVF
jgi:hypothetical protein